jgi:hypothetical protein
MRWLGSGDILDIAIKPRQGINERLMVGVRIRVAAQEGTISSISRSMRPLPDYGISLKLNDALKQKNGQFFLYRSLQCGYHPYFRWYRFREQALIAYCRVFDRHLTESRLLMCDHGVSTNKKIFTILQSFVSVLQS